MSINESEFSRIRNKVVATERKIEGLTVNGSNLTASSGVNSSLGIFQTITGSNISSVNTFTNKINISTNGGIEFGMSTGGTGTISGSFLDDYEYGRWTPIEGGSGWTPDPIFDNAKYVKIGKLVNIWCNVRNAITNNLSSSAQSKILGLPFAAESIATVTIAPDKSNATGDYMIPAAITNTEIKFEKDSTILVDTYYVFSSYLTK